MYEIIQFSYNLYMFSCLLSYITMSIDLNRDLCYMLLKSRIYTSYYGSHYVAQGGLKLIILLPNCWEYVYI